MKKFKRLFALAVAAALVATMSITAFAAPSITIKTTSTSAEASADTTAYTWYRILDASIEEDPTGAPAQTGGKVSYFVTASDRAAQLTNTGLFNVVQVGSTDKWYVELKDDSTTAEAIATAFSGANFDLTKFPTGTFAQEAVAGTATTGTVDPGYYYITSTAGSKVVIQTLTAVEIDEKNSFPTVNKTLTNTDDKSAQIGDDIEYTLTVTIPETANDEIVLTDTMTEGLTFKAIDSVKAGEADVSYTLAPSAPAAADKEFTITFDADTVTANQGATITVKYVATLNEKAVVDPADDTDEDETSNDNTIVLAYGQHYTSKTKTVETDTQSFTFDKVDVADKTKLPGAVFELRLGDEPLKLVEVTAGEAYRIAMPNETGAVTEITTVGKVITVSGVDGDVTYQLVETAPPAGYKLPANPSTDVKASTDNKLAVTIENTKGGALPSTGGIGTTIFYVLGSILVIGAGVLLVTKRRMDA